MYPSIVLLLLNIGTCLCWYTSPYNPQTRGQWNQLACDFSVKNCSVFQDSTTDDNGVWVTTDYGATWRTSGAEIPGGSTTNGGLAQIQHVTMSGDGNVVYSVDNGFYKNPSSGYILSPGLRRSMDGGATWTSLGWPSGTIVPDGYQCMTCVGTDTTGKFVVLGIDGAGLYYSSNYGNHFNITGQTGNTNFKYPWADCKVRGNTIYALQQSFSYYYVYTPGVGYVGPTSTGKDTILWSSPTAYMNSWKPLPYSTQDPMLYVMRQQDQASFGVWLFKAVDADVTGQYVYVAAMCYYSGTLGGAWRSTNFGRNFTAMTFPDVIIPYDIACSGNGQCVLTGTTHSIIGEPPLVYLSSDYGATFKILKSSIFDAHVQMLKYAVSTTGQNMMVCTIGPCAFSNAFGAEGSWSLTGPLPTIAPTPAPTAPTAVPTRTPTAPTAVPTFIPTPVPSTPTAVPTPEPTRPTTAPTPQPTAPTARPSPQPTAPTFQPSPLPTPQPTQPTVAPSPAPSPKPSFFPTGQPSRRPSSQPTRQPSSQPSRQPSKQPISFPTGQPSKQPSSQPSRQPSSQPSRQPSKQPTSRPSGRPSRQPSAQPSGEPSVQPSAQPSFEPSTQPSVQPSGHPSGQPSAQPSPQPSWQPSSQPSRQPRGQPTSQPSRQPSAQPSVQPSNQPNSAPSLQPSAQPTSLPTSSPTQVPDWGLLMGVPIATTAVVASLLLVFAVATRRIDAGLKPVAIFLAAMVLEVCLVLLPINFGEGDTAHTYIYFITTAPTHSPDWGLLLGVPVALGVLIACVAVCLGVQYWGRSAASFGQPKWGLFTTGATGCIESWDARLSDFLPYSKKEVTGRDFLQDFVPASHQPLVREALKAALDGKGPYSVSFPWLGPHSQLYPVRLRTSPKRDSAGVISGIVGSVNLPKTPLKGPPAPSSGASAPAVAGLFTTDSAGAIDSWDEKISQFLPYVRSDVLGRKIAENFVPQKVFGPQVREALKRALEGKEPLKAVEFPWVGPQGQLFPVRVCASPKHGPTGAVVGTDSVVWPVRSPLAGSSGARSIGSWWWPCGPGSPSGSPSKGCIDTTVLIRLTGTSPASSYQVLTLTLSPEDTVGTVKELVFQLKAIPFAKQRPLYNGNYLEDDKRTLRSHGIEAKSVVILDAAPTVDSITDAELLGPGSGDGAGTGTRMGAPFSAGPLSGAPTTVSAFKIFVKPIGKVATAAHSQLFILAVHPHITVASLKALVTEKTGIEGIKQRLLLQGNLLEDDHVLEDCGVTAGSLVTLNANAVTVSSVLRDGCHYLLCALCDFAKRDRKVYASANITVFIQPTGSAVTALGLQAGAGVNNSHKFEVAVDPSNTVAMLKWLVVQKKGVDFSQQSFLFRGATIQDELCLADYGIESGSVIELVDGDGSGDDIEAGPGVSPVSIISGPRDGRGSVVPGRTGAEAIQSVNTGKLIFSVPKKSLLPQAVISTVRDLEGVSADPVVAANWGEDPDNFHFAVPTRRLLGGLLQRGRLSVSGIEVPILAPPKVVLVSSFGAPLPSAQSVVDSVMATRGLLLIPVALPADREVSYATVLEFFCPPRHLRVFRAQPEERVGQRQEDVFHFTVVDDWWILFLRTKYIIIGPAADDSDVYTLGAGGNLA